jgi:hypothetical protein
MRLGTTALVATALTGALYFAAPSASALPAPSRADVVKGQTAGAAEEVRYRRRGYRRWGHRPNRYRYYGYGGYPSYYGSPYYYRPYRYGYGGWGGYPYYRRPGFGIYLGF